MRGTHVPYHGWHEHEGQFGHRSTFNVYLTLILKPHSQRDGFRSRLPLPLSFIVYGKRTRPFLSPDRPRIECDTRSSYSYCGLLRSCTMDILFQIPATCQSQLCHLSFTSSLEPAKHHDFPRQVCYEFVRSYSVLIMLM